MNKNAKAAVAVGAAALLLLGGGGTLAVWNADQTVDAGSVYTGTLALDSTSLDGTWYYYDALLDLDDYSTLGTEVDTVDYLVVPEDELIYIATGIELTAEGGNLYFTFGASTGGATASGFTIDDVTAITADLASPYTTLAAGEFTAPAATAGIDVYNVVTGDGLVTADFTVSFVLTFDADGTDDQDVYIDLADAEITVNQVIPTT